MGRTRTRYFQLQPSDLTQAEMKELGFRGWSEESTMMLIPLWTFPFLADEMTTTSISGQTETLKKSEMDTDNRFGCLAFGVIPKDKVNQKQQKEVINEN